MARVPQILLNHRHKHTGQLAFLSFALAFLGNLARVFTTLVKLSDPLTLASHAIAATLNGVIVGQIIFYPKKTASKKIQ
jgi:PQ loop repeat